MFAPGAFLCYHGRKTRRRTAARYGGVSMTTEHVKPNAKALLPIALFLVLYLGNGIFFEYIKPAEGQMGFYVVSVVLAFSIALIAAFAQNRKRTFQENIRSCAFSGLVEIADHTYSLHSTDERKGVLRRSDESYEDYRRMLWSDLDRSRRIIEQACGELPVTLAYPYGFCNDESEQLVRELGYKVTLGCEEKTNVITVGDEDCLFRLHRFNRSSDRSAASLLAEN